MNKNKIIFTIAIAIVLFASFLLFIKTSNDEGIPVVSNSDSLGEYKGKIDIRNEDSVGGYKNETLGFSMKLPSVVELYEEFLVDKEETFSISFYKQPKAFSYIIPVSERCFIEPVKVVNIKVIQNKFSSLGEWLDYQKKDFPEYYENKSIEKIDFNKQEGLKFVDTLENRLNIEGKYLPKERVVTFINGKIFDISIYTNQITSPKDIDLIWGNFKIDIK